MEQHDIIIIGAGAAGLMTAANLNCPALLLERQEKAGKKLYITGKGRCNLTNDCSSAEVLKSVVNGEKFLTSALNRFPPSEVMSFFNSCGLNLKTERGGRVFPVSDKASDVTKALLTKAESNGAKVVYNTCVTSIKKEEGGFSVFCEGGERFFAKIVVLCCGGKSYPSTGSDGRAYSLLRSLGHTVTDTYPSLVSLHFVNPNPALMGLTFKHVTATVTCENGERLTESGELLFTHLGVSGPIILTLSSKAARKHIRILNIDMWPQLTTDELDKKLLNLLSKDSARALKNVIPDLLPKSLALFILDRCGIFLDKKAAELSKADRQKIISTIKSLSFDIASTGGFGEAVITSGGAELKEFNPSTMQSRLVEGLYVAGEMLDIDALTGGYNLQIAFSTALAASSDINKRL